MRKQDRIAQEQQTRQQNDSTKESPQPQPKDREQMRGRASDEHPPRQPGSKLPLPE
jgi:hypothetical protein